MPSLPPKYFITGARSFFNGAPSRAADAADLADYSAWLATVRRHAIPLFIGRYLVTGHTYETRVTIPHYTEALAFGLYVTGEGSVAVECNPDDTWDSTVPVDASQAHDYEDDGEWKWAMQPIDSIAVDTEWRALDTTDQSSPHQVGITITVTDGATVACRVHHVYLLPLVRTQGSALPA